MVMKDAARIDMFFYRESLNLISVYFINHNNYMRLEMAHHSSGVVPASSQVLQDNGMPALCNMKIVGQ